ncbi:hypothetical protein B0H19DRAFT_1253601 [Mycena capillaripes]|nr:hypothetical protein B0H19DRAFT_1253601 [Mycena capillaripes]
MRPDDVHNFLMEAHRISQESRFIVDSLPNAEQPAVERVLHQLGAICTILTNLDDPHSAPETIIALEAYVNGLIQPLEHFLANPPPLHRRSRGQIFVEEIAASGSTGGIVAFPDSFEG